MQTIPLSELVNGMLSQGVHPRQVRLELARRGIRWSYGFTASKGGVRVAHVGPRERARNMKRAGLKPCEGCGLSMGINVVGTLCTSCLEAKWGRS